MKTLFNNIFNERLQHASRLAITALLALVMVVAALPQPALAATPCVAHHTVKSGDTTSMIAHIYGLTWAEIAKANKMKPSDKLKVGQSLCIPSSSTSSGGAVTGKMTAKANGTVVTVTMSDFNKRFVWYINVNDPSKKVSGVFKVGHMIVPVKTTVVGAFKLPLDLRKTSPLNVCAKNVGKAVKICHVITNK